MCEEGEVACTDGSGCISTLDRCDFFQDCADNSDEENCDDGDAATCADDEFLCVDDDICYPTSYRCDGHPDCSDASDEQSCESCDIELETCCAHPHQSTQTSFPSSTRLHPVSILSNMHIAVLTAIDVHTGTEFDLSSLICSEHVTRPQWRN